MKDESRSNARASEWNTLTAMVEMKIGKFKPKVPIKQHEQNQSQIRPFPHITKTF